MHGGGVVVFRVHHLPRDPTTCILYYCYFFFFTPKKIDALMTATQKKRETKIFRKLCEISFTSCHFCCSEMLPLVNRSRQRLFVDHKRIIKTDTHTHRININSRQHFIREHQKSYYHNTGTTISYSVSIFTLLQYIQ